MTTISMSEFGRNWNAIMNQVRQGETVVVTDDDKPAVRLAPAVMAPAEDAGGDSTSYSDLAKQWDGSKPEYCRSLSNEETDRIVYGL
jgi:prevent-host-death family protein